MKEIPYGSMDTEQLIQRDMGVKWENAYQGRENINLAWTNIVLNKSRKR